MSPRLSGSCDILQQASNKWFSSYQAVFHLSTKTQQKLKVFQWDLHHFRELRMP